MRHVGSPLPPGRGAPAMIRLLVAAADLPVTLPPRPVSIVPMTLKIPALAEFRRIVVKVGSSLLIDAAAGRVKQGWLASLVQDVARLHGERRDLLVVSSGAIALGRSVLKLPKGSLKLE